MPIIDTHTHLSAKWNMEAVERTIKVTGLEKILVAASPLGYWSSALTEPVAQCLEKFPDRLCGLIGIHPPDVEKSLQDIDAYHKKGFIGIKLMPTVGYYADDEKYRKVFEETNARKMICLTHCGWCAPTRALGHDMPQSTKYSHPYHFEPLIRIFPDIDFIFAHGGGRTMYPAAWELVSYHENAWVDTCGGQGPWALQHGGPLLALLNWDRVLYGTDLLVGDDGSTDYWVEHQSSIPDILRYLDLADKTQAVMHDNARRLLEKHGVAF